MCYSQTFSLICVCPPFCLFICLSFRLLFCLSVFFLSIDSSYGQFVLFVIPSPGQISNRLHFFTRVTDPDLVGSSFFDSHIRVFFTWQSDPESISIISTFVSKEKGFIRSSLGPGPGLLDRPDPDHFFLLRLGQYPDPGHLHTDPQAWFYQGLFALFCCIIQRGKVLQCRLIVTRNKSKKR